MLAPVATEFSVVWLCMLYRCNNRCEWCYAGSNHYEQVASKLMSPVLHEGILNLLSSLAVPRVILIGGEPTLYPKLGNLVAEIAARGIGCGMVTNGRKFKDEQFVSELRSAGLQSATFSIEGSCAEIHDATTAVRGSFRDAMLGLKNAQAAGLSVATNIVISTLNAHDLERVVDEMCALGVRTITFNVCGITISHEHQNKKLMLSPRAAAKAYERAHHHARRAGVRARLVTPLPRCNFDDLETLKEDHAVPGGPCQLVSGRNFVVDYDGSILPCTHFGEFPLFRLVRDDGAVMSRTEFVDAYRSAFASEFRRTVSRHPSSKCQGCGENCTGGCPIYWLQLDPEVEIRGHARRHERDWMPVAGRGRDFSLPILAS